MGGKGREGRGREINGRGIEGERGRKWTHGKEGKLGGKGKGV